MTYGVRASASTSEEVLAELQPVDMLVIDVRDDGGGNSSTAGALAGRLADRRCHYGYVRYRDGRARTDFGQ